MYIHTGKRRGKGKKKGKTARLRAKLRAKNRRRINGMAGRRLSAKLKKTRK